MSHDTIKTWYIAGLQAYRSASEQGKEAASQAEGQFTNPELKKLAGEGEKKKAPGCFSSIPGRAAGRQAAVCSAA